MMHWTVICFSTVDWDSYHQRPQLMMKALAERGHRVVYVNNLGMRSPRFADMGRVLARLRRSFRTTMRDGGDVPENLIVESPVIPPFPQVGWIRRLAARILARRLSRRIPSSPVVVWSFLPSPVVTDVAHLLDAQVLIYDWCDDISERLLFATDRHRTRVKVWEEDMSRAADLVLFANDDFASRRGVSARRTQVVPHGVELGRSTSSDIADDLARLASPRIGYLGAITDWIDLELIASLARARPDWSFPLVGPVHTRVEDLDSLANVVVFGERPYSEVPSLLAGFDVGLIPYRVTAATRSASPLKMREYLAAGVPVVSVDIPDTRNYSPPVRLAAGTAEFLDQIEGALTTHRLDVPRLQRSWHDVVGEVTDVVDGLLATQRRSPTMDPAPLSRESLGS